MNALKKPHAIDPSSGTETTPLPRSASNGDAYLVAASFDATAHAMVAGPQRPELPPGGAKPPVSRALRRVADALGSVLGAMALAAIVLDADGHVVYANPRLLALIGHDGDAVGEPWLDLYIDQPSDDVKAAFLHLLAGDPTVETYTLDVLKRGGGHARIHWHNALVRDGERVVGTASIGEVLMERVDTDASAASRAAREAAEVVAMARAAVDAPETATIPLVKLIAEHCAQLAEERPDAAAAHIRSEFRVDG